MAQQFEPSETGSQTRTQRMTADEARAVIALWQQERVEQTGLSDKPAVPDVAEGLDVSVEDVQRLLGEVRAQQAEEARLLAQDQAFSEIRLAEGQRQLAEIQRQRAELRREQQANEQGQNSHLIYVAEKRTANPVGMIIGLLLFILWICFIVSLADNRGGSPFRNSPTASGCTTTAPNGKPEPCSPELEGFVKNVIIPKTHR